MYIHNYVYSYHVGTWITATCHATASPWVEHRCCYCTTLISSVCNSSIIGGVTVSRFEIAN